MTTAKHWTGEAIEAALATQGIAVAPGRAERLARGQQALLEAAAADPLAGSLDFHVDPAGFVLALSKCK